MLSILFYHPQCEHSRKILIQLRQSNLENQIRLFNIEKKQPPKHIKSVPTLVLSNLNEPLIGTEVSDWINQLNSNNIKENNTTKQKSKKKFKKSKDIEAFDSLEMGSHFSDNFSYIEKKEIPHNFKYI